MVIEDNLGNEKRSVSNEGLLAFGRELLDGHQSHLAFSMARDLISEEPLYPDSIQYRFPKE